MRKVVFVVLNTGEREDWDGFEVRLSLFGVHGDVFGAPQPCRLFLVFLFSTCTVSKINYFEKR